MNGGLTRQYLTGRILLVALLAMLAGCSTWFAPPLRRAKRRSPGTSRRNRLIGGHRSRAPHRHRRKWLRPRRRR